MRKITYIFAVIMYITMANMASAVVPEFKAPETPDFSRYQGILNRMPFGAPPPDPGSIVSTLDAKTAAQEAKDQQMLARKLNMSCVNITPSGTPAVGFTDLSVKPPVNYYLLVGGSGGGWTLEDANYDEEWAELEKEGTTIFVKLGKGLMAEPPVKKKEAQTSVSAKKKELRNHKKISELTDEEKAALLIPEFGTVRLASDPNMPPSPLPTPQEEARQLKVAEDIARIKAEGGSIRSYKAQLRERYLKEQEEKAQLEELARQKVEELAQKATAEEFAKHEREINIDLIAAGARPLSTVQLSEEEEVILREEGMVSDH